MEREAGNFKTFLCFLVLLLIWILSLIFPVTMPVFGMLFLFSGIYMRGNSKTRSLGVVMAANGIALLALTLVIYTLLLVTKVQ